MGTRNLEDNWRRSNKTSFVSDFENTTQGNNDQTEDNLEEDLASILRGIPSTQEEKDAAHKKIQDAMYKLGVLYREKLNSIKIKRDSSRFVGKISRI